MPIPNRAPDGSLYCIHGTFPDHCGVCIGAYVATLESQLAAERARVRVLREALDMARHDLLSILPPGSWTLRVISHALQATAQGEK